MDRDTVQKIREKCDDYKHTVWALLAFADHSMWNFEDAKIYPNSRYSLGRRMVTIEGNTVTPDLAVQRSIQYGLVCEAKKDLPISREYWIKILDQLTKYNTIKEGWFASSQIDNYDVVFLTDISRSVDFGDFFEKSNRSWTHSTAIVGFEPTTETSDTFITLKKERGDLSDTALNESLRRVTKVPLSKIETTIGKVKFYDSEPPLVYTARIFWENICSAKISAETWSKDKKAHILELNIEEITEELQRFFGQLSEGTRDQEIPNKKWIKKVLDFFVIAGYAEKTDDDETFVVLWKEIRGDILERFSRLWLKLGQKRKKMREIEKTEQLGLF